MGVESVAWSLWRKESRRIGATGATALCGASPLGAAAAAGGGGGGLDLFPTKRLTQLSSQFKCCLGPPVSGRTASLWTCFLKQSSSFDSQVSSASIFRVQSTSSSHIFNTRPDLSYNVFGRKKYGNIFKFHSQRPFGFRTFRTSVVMAAPATGAGSLVRQNFHEECEGKINRQINMELYASYVYLSMAYYFDRDDVAFPGLHKYFKKASDEEREHAEKFMKYQNERGGRIALQPIAQPNKDEWENPMTAVTAALELEKTVNATLLDLHAVAGSHNDPQLCDFLETHFLEEQVKAIKELSGYITQLKRCGPGLGEYIFDKELNE